MGVIKIGDSVKMKNGGEAKIISEFGSGGQGTVYKVSYNGKDYALKWYHLGAFKGKEKEFRAGSVRSGSCCQRKVIGFSFERKEKREKKGKRK